MYYHHKLRNDGEFCLDDIYFKDAFTKTGDDLNIEVNNASVDSLSSNSNTFNLDEAGNLTVNTISCNSIAANESNLPSSSNLNLTEIINTIYPVGSIYMSVNEVEPTALFGGTWEKLKDKFLLGSGDEYSLNSTGGEKEHLLTVNEMPSHSHSVSGNTQNGGTHKHNVSGGANVQSSGGSEGLESYGSRYKTFRTIGDAAMSGGSHNHSISLTSATTGNGSSHNNMPPYITVNIWKRIS